MKASVGFFHAIPKGETKSNDYGDGGCDGLSLLPCAADDDEGSRLREATRADPERRNRAREDRARSRACPQRSASADAGARGHAPARSREGPDRRAGQVGRHPSAHGGTAGGPAAHPHRGRGDRREVGRPGPHSQGLLAPRAPHRGNAAGECQRGSGSVHPGQPRLPLHHLQGCGLGNAPIRSSSRSGCRSVRTSIC